MGRALIFANGAAHDGEMVRRAILEDPDALVVAADGGARLAWQSYGLTPDIIIGDMDSLSAAELETFRSQGVQIEQHNPEKDETDLELALLWAATRDVQHIRIIGATGRRMDQTFGNVYLLAMPQLAGRDVRLVAGNQQMWLAHAGEHCIEGEVDDTLSLLPLSGDVENIRTENLYYPLTGETLRFGPARGMSNVLTATTATVTFDAGLLLIVHTPGTPE
ncbi:MAG: thiamine diphosphokinase [Chloroflexota bacterium]